MADLLMAPYTGSDLCGARILVTIGVILIHHIHYASDNFVPLLDVLSWPDVPGSL